MNRRRAVAAWLFLLLLASSTRAQVLFPAADAHVTDNVGDAIPNYFNFGGLGYLLVQNDPARTYKTYLRYDLAPIAAAGKAGVRSATLVLTFSRFRDPRAADVTEADTITVYGITDNLDVWTEGTDPGRNNPVDLNFHNAPHNDKASSAALLEAGNADGAAVRQAGTITIPRDARAGTDFRVDVAPFVNWALLGGAWGKVPGGDTDKLITFVLVHTAGNAGVANNGVQFFSKENTGGPNAVNVPAFTPRLLYVPEEEKSVLTGTVATIVDAETLVVRGVGNVRLAGVVALRDPKRKPQPNDDLFGEEAERAARRLAAGHKVRLEMEGKDTGGAALAWVFLEDGTLLNEQLVRRGYAKMGPLPPTSRHAERLRAAEKEAKAARRGLWPKQKTSSAPPPKPAGNKRQP